MLQDIAGVMQALAKVRLFSNLIQCLVTLFQFWVITFFSDIKGVSGMLTPVTLKSSLHSLLEGGEEIRLRIW